MRKQLDISAQIERLYFWLRVSKEKFKLALDQGRDFSELKSILTEIRKLERDIKENKQSALSSNRS
jgi:hypothetical protein